MAQTFLNQEDEPKTVTNYTAPTLYKRFYLSPRYTNIFDTDWFATLSTFGFYPHIKKLLLKHIKPQSWTLLAGNSYGWLIKDVADKVTDKGYLEVIDPIPLQVTHAQDKLSPWPHFKCITDDIESYHSSKKYDTIVCYFLLHELPDKKKKRAIKNISSLLANNGEAIFIDYGIAHKYHPLKYLLQAYNNIFEPFADTLSIATLKDFMHDDALQFSSKSIFGGLYQKTVMTLKK